MALLNKGIFYGHSSRSKYDKCAYDDYLSESVGSLIYRINPNQINNCNACLSVFGPRTSASPYSYGVSSTTGHVSAQSQQLVDVESILSNRNVIASKCKDGKVNDIDVTKFHLQHARVCNDYLDPVATHLTNPPQNYRGMSINRFYDLNKNPQANIFWDFGVNTKLEAKDNYKERVPRLVKYDPTLPREFTGTNPPCKSNCFTNCANGKNCASDQI
jgi:hypothetical protein